jgi:hypothetical protein
MEQKLSRYIRHHTISVTIFVLLSFIILFLGEFYLFRKIMYVSKIVSEGFMQVKEAVKPEPAPTVLFQK